MKFHLIQLNTILFHSIQFDSIQFIELNWNGIHVSRLWAPHPELLLLLAQSLVLDGGQGQLEEGGAGVLEPGPQLLVRLPELAGQGLGALQLQAALRVQLADRPVLLQQGLDLSLAGEETWSWLHQHWQAGPRCECGVSGGMGGA